MPAGHALTGRDSICFEDLLKFKLLAETQTGTLGALIALQLASRGIHLLSQFKCTGADATIGLVKAGAGIAVVTDAVARRHAMNLAVQSIPLQDPWTSFASVVVVHRKRMSSPLVKQVLAALLQPPGPHPCSFAHERAWVTPLTVEA